ncbi:hypothetical protein EV187_1136 [Agromyces ramosus]|uniref:Trypsin-co-occurring domain-containing protein n=1 Tax=Agromyces ramosus TaxID=33879 RepID=A0A4Q7MK00_9MICO|nr:hypothetical protein EV187_1136 [Agromyces ramosus]
MRYRLRDSRRGDRIVGDVLEFKTGDGVVLVETIDVSDGPITRGGGPRSTVIEASQSLEQVVGRVGPIVKGIVSEIRQSAEWPDEVEVEFAVKISADSNLVIARAGGAANFRIALRWGGPRPR